MKNTAEDPHCLRTGTAPGLADLFRRNNEALEEIAKGLEEFLEVGPSSLLSPPHQWGPQTPRPEAILPERCGEQLIR